MLKRLPWVILAAGKGSRCWPLTDGLSKPTLPLAGETILGRLIRQAHEFGHAGVTVVVSDDATAEHAKRAGEHLRTDVQVVWQKGKHGTGAAVQAADPDANVFVCNGDVIVSNAALRKFLGSWEGGPQAGIVEVADRSQYGAVSISNGVITSLSEKRREGPGAANAGMYVLDEEMIDRVFALRPSERGEYELSAVLNGGKFRAVVVNDWVSVERPWHLLDALPIALGEDRVMGESLKAQGDIHPFAVLEGSVYVGPGAKVLPGAYLRGPIWIGEGSVVGPNCVVRGPTILCNGTRVGPGCEIKASLLFPGAKVPHLSYVGDSVLGRDVNLGAGTILTNLRIDHREVAASCFDGRFLTGRKKFGSVLGHGTQTAAGSILKPGFIQECGSSIRE